MASDIYGILQGLRIEDEATLDSVSLLQGTGLPGGDTSFEDSGGLGSLFMRRDAEADNLQLYYKWTTVNNSSADWKAIASKEYVDALAQGLSWREPALVLDSTLYANVAAAEAAANVADTVDGVTIAPDDRILLTNLTTGNENVYIVSGTTGNWTFTEDTNLATDGDAIMIQEGSSADTQWVYDGTQWVQFGSTSAGAELGYIRDFIGKTGPGAEFPTFSSTNLIINSPNPGFDNLESAIGKLDAGLGTGNVVNTGGNWAVSDDLAFAGSTGAAGTLTVTDVLDELNVAIGDRTYTEDNVVTDGESVAASIDALDIAVGEQQQQNLIISGTNVGPALTTVDTIPLADATQVKWLVQMRENATTGNRRGVEITALTDGTTVDSSQANTLRLPGGAGVAGFNYQVIISGTDLVLQLGATAAFDYVIRRLGYSAF